MGTEGVLYKIELTKNTNEAVWLWRWRCLWLWWQLWWHDHGTYMKRPAKVPNPAAPAGHLCLGSYFNQILKH